MKNLDLQARPCESRSRVWQHNAPKLAEEKPKKQVRFDLEGNLGNTPTLPQGLTLFLVKGVAKEQDDTPDPFTSVPESSPQQPLEGPQHCPTHAGGTRSKVTPQPSAGQSQF